MKQHIIILSLLLFLLASCEKKQKMVKDIYINHDIEFCGVTDPAENLDIIKAEIDSDLNIIDEYPQYYKNSWIGVFEDSSGDQTWVQYDYLSLLHPETEELHSVATVYNCDTTMFGGIWNANPFVDNAQSSVMAAPDGTVSYSPDMFCHECVNYFHENKLVDVISHISNLPEGSNN